MPRHPRQTYDRKVNPNYFVFCEGETEVEYVTFLSRRVRKSLHVIPIKQASNINKRIVSQTIEPYVPTSADKIYLMFDLDVKGMLERLNSISGACLLVSNPCFELWLLLHFKDHKAELTSRECLKHLEKHMQNYKKGKFSDSHKMSLMDCEVDAKNRASKLTSPCNPSTTVYKLLEDILT